MPRTVECRGSDYNRAASQHDWSGVSYVVVYDQTALIQQVYIQTQLAAAAMSGSRSLGMHSQCISTDTMLLSATIAINSLCTNHASGLHRIHLHTNIVKLHFRR